MFDGRWSSSSNMDVPLDVLEIYVMDFADCCLLAACRCCGKRYLRRAEKVAFARLSRLEARLCLKDPRASTWGRHVHMLLRCTKVGRRAVFEASQRVWESIGARVREERFRELRKAVRDDNGQNVIDLVEAGVDMEYRHERCLPAVHQACLDGRATALEALLDCGASVNATADGYLPLNLAATYGHLETMRVILRFHPECIDAVDGFGMTALLSSVHVGEANSCAILLDEGCDIDVQAYGKDAEGIAMRRGKPTILALLRKCKAARVAVLRRAAPGGHPPSIPRWQHKVNTSAY